MGRLKVIEHFNGFEVEDTKTGRTHWLGDGVDVFEDMTPGDPGFVEAWERALNSDPEAMEAYFPRRGRNPGDDDEEEPEDEELDPDFAEDNVVITEERRGEYSVLFSGRDIGHFLNTDAALIAIAKEMDRQQYWPDVYDVNDHGNVAKLALKIHRSRNGKVLWVESTEVRSWV